MRTASFFTLLIVVCLCSLCFRLNALFAQTTDVPPNQMDILAQKVSLQQAQAAQTPSAQPVDTEQPDAVDSVLLSEAEQNALADLSDVKNVAYLADLYGHMRPKAAARILQQLSNAQITLILRQMPTTQTAAILGEFPANRAATLSLQLSR